MKQLILVNSNSDAGILKLWTLSPKHPNIRIVALPIQFDSCELPIKFDFTSIRKFLFSDKQSVWSYQKSLLEFIKLDFSKYNHVALWHGNSTNDLLFLMFFAKYFNKPFCEMNISHNINEDGLAYISNYCYMDSYKNQIGHEPLVTQKRMTELINQYDSLLINDTGFHTTDGKGNIISLNAESKWLQIKNTVNENTISLARLVGQIMRQNVFNSESFAFKLICYFINNKKLLAINKNTNKIIKNITDLSYMNTMIKQNSELL